MAADLQDPPEAIAELVAQWREGAQVVWAARTSAGLASRLYYTIMRKVAGVRSLPPAGADFFLIDRAAIDAVRQFREQHTSIFALITWMGFRQATVTCAKRPRLHGSSGWTAAKKVTLAVDSITAFTVKPLRFMTWVGLSTAVLGFVGAAIVALHALGGRPVPGYASLMVAVLVLGGVQMLMIGVLGEYVWRALEESRRRPRYLVEERTEAPQSEPRHQI